MTEEVMKRLQKFRENSIVCSVSPADLLVALHLIDPSKDDLVFIIKATALCFAEKQIYTQDVLAAVLQRLTEEPEIPVLMMRTVLQAHTLYPNLGPLVLNILTLLVKKEVWNNKVAWEGWVKCCERLVPRSAALLVSLPARALAACCAAPRLQRALAQHVSALPAHQRTALPAHVLHMAQPSEEQFPSAAPMPVPPPNPVEPLPPGMDC